MQYWDFEIDLTSASGTAVAAETMAAGGGSLWGMILEAILWGFAALLTPCVFPMVPMTVSFFLKGSENKARGRFRAGMYGLFIILLYTLPIAALIIITRWLGGDAVTADIFNWLATHWLPNIIFFIVFMIFAASFFGAFDITMPSKLVNKTDTKSDKGGLGGIFFMALTLVLVSFSCTGPIVGNVLINSISGGNFWQPIITMFAFSVAFALPFTVLALFPSLLNKLPKSGGWLNSVKVVLGFVELALGLKFLSVADQTYHWGILDREIYLALWIAIFTLLGLYLIGKAQIQTRQRTEVHFGRQARTRHHRIRIRRLYATRHVGCTAQGTLRIYAAHPVAGLRARCLYRPDHQPGLYRYLDDDLLRRYQEIRRFPRAAALRHRRLLPLRTGHGGRRQSRQTALHRLHRPRLRELPRNGTAGMVGPDGTGACSATNSSWYRSTATIRRMSRKKTG